MGFSFRDRAEGMMERHRILVVSKQLLASKMLHAGATASQSVPSFPQRVYSARVLTMLFTGAGQ